VELERQQESEPAFQQGSVLAQELPPEETEGEVVQESPPEEKEVVREQQSAQRLEKDIPLEEAEEGTRCRSDTDKRDRRDKWGQRHRNQFVYTIGHRRP
jgi:hypothetical protein